MKQHAIPQNVLDVEFKLFTRFTVREFVYIACGIGFGGIFLFMFSKGDLPGILAIPMFLLSSGIGLFLGIVPINDQKADVFLKNYITAITSPTMRVWKNKYFDEKLEVIAQQRGLTITTGSADQTQKVDQSKAKIIGSNAGQMASNQFIEQNKIQELDQEELARLQAIEATANSIGGNAPQAQPYPQAQSYQVTTEPAPPVQVAQPTTQNVQPVVAQPSPVITASVIPQVQTAAATPANSTTAVNIPSIITQPASVVTASPTPKLVISPQNAMQYAITLNTPIQLTGSINTMIVDKQGKPLPQIIVMLKDTQGKVLLARQTSEKGIFSSEKTFTPGEYVLEIKNDMLAFPEVRILLDDKILPLMRISPL